MAAQLFGWLLLALASRALPQRWQERAAAADTEGWLARWLQGRRVGPTERARAREELLPANPVLWLMSRGPDFRKIAWAIVGVWGAVVLLVSALAPRGESAMMLGWYGIMPFGFALKCLLAVQACRFFVEARRNGALEMLLCTPLTSRDILGGQAVALRRNFLRPIAGLLGLLFVPVVVRAATARAWDGEQIGTTFIGLFFSGFACLRMYADCYAVVWFGMWLALTLKKPNLAPALTILFVLVLPSALCVLDVFADLFFILWGMTKLRQQDLRFLITHQYQPIIPR